MKVIVALRKWSKFNFLILQTNPFILFSPHLFKVWQFMQQGHIFNISPLILIKQFYSINWPGFINYFNETIFNFCIFFCKNMGLSSTRADHYVIHDLCQGLLCKCSMVRFLHYTKWKKVKCTIKNDHQFFWKWVIIGKAHVLATLTS